MTILNLLETTQDQSTICGRDCVYYTVYPDWPSLLGYLFILGYPYKWWDLEEVKLRELNYTVTTHQAIPYISNGKDAEL